MEKGWRIANAHRENIMCECVCVKALRGDSRWIRRRGLQGSPQRQRKAGLIDRSASGRL